MIALTVLNSAPAFAAAKCESKLTRNASPSSPTTLKAGLIAYQPEGSLDFDRFAAKISALAEQAVKSGANFIIFPELLVQDLVDHSRGEDSFGEQVRTLSSNWPKFQRLNQDLAKKLGVIIYSGTFTRTENRNVYNTGALVFPDGEVFLQDKMFLTPFEKRWGLTAGTKLNVVSTAWGNWVNLICYDCEIPALSNKIAEYKPTLILAPSMTEGVSGFHRVRWTAQARAIEHKSFVVHVGMVGGPPEWPNHGQCSLLAPFDDVMCGLIAESPVNTPGSFRADLDFAKLQQSRASDSVYPGRDQSDVKN